MKSSGYLFFLYNRKDAEEALHLMFLVRAADEEAVGPMDDTVGPSAEWQWSCFGESQYVVLCIGHSGISGHQMEVLNRAMEEQRRVLPVMLPGFASDSPVPFFLSEMKWLDLRGGITHTEVMQLTRRGIAEHAFQGPYWVRLGDSREVPELASVSESSDWGGASGVRLSVVAASLAVTAILLVSHHVLPYGLGFWEVFGVYCLCYGLILWALLHWNFAHLVSQLTRSARKILLPLWKIIVAVLRSLTTHGLQARIGFGVDSALWGLLKRKPMSDATALYAGMSALMAALQVWQRERDYKLAKRTFDLNFKKESVSAQTKLAASQLRVVAPEEVIKKLHNNAKKCWDHWLEAEDEPLLPGQEREADAAVKACVCRQLRRIIDLNGSLPDEWKKQWDQYQCETRK